MKKPIIVFAWIAMACVFVSCVTKATEEEIRQACTNLQNLRGESAPGDAAAAIAQIEQDYKAKEADLAERKEETLRALDEEMQTKLAALDTGKKKKKNKESEEEKQKITDEYDQKKLEAVNAVKPLIDKLGPDRQSDIEKAKQKADAAAAKAKQNVDECTARNLKEGVSQKMVQCRITAETVDKYWNGCGLY